MSIHPFFSLLILHRVMRYLKPIQKDHGHEARYILDCVSTQSHKQFKDACQSKCVFGLGEKNRVPGGNPWKEHPCTRERDRNQTPKPQRCDAIALATINCLILKYILIFIVLKCFVSYSEF